MILRYVLSLTVLLTLCILCSGHGAMILPPVWQDKDGAFVQKPGDGWWYSGVTGYINDKVFIPNGTAELFDEDSPFRTWCTALNRDFKGQCSFYARHPWLTPGTAPLKSNGGTGTGGSPCGVLDGTTQDARSLPGNTMPPKWKAGQVMEMAWAIYANHGGGYQYRLCPLPSSGNRMDLTEECFQQGVLRFAVPTVDLQNAKNSTNAPKHTVKAVRVSNGTHPPGFEWAMNPIPGFGPDGNTKFPFMPLYPGACGTKGDTTTTECPDKIMNWRIIDKVEIPGDLKPGKYVVSMRWDAEQTPQVWASCSDIEIINSAPTPPTPPPPPPTPAPPTPQPAPTPAPAPTPNMCHASDFACSGYTYYGSGPAACAKAGCCWTPNTKDNCFYPKHTFEV